MPPFPMTEFALGLPDEVEPRGERSSTLPLDSPRLFREHEIYVDILDGESAEKMLGEVG